MNSNTPTFNLEACYLGLPLCKTNLWCCFQTIWMEEVLETSRYFAPRGLDAFWRALYMFFALICSNFYSCHFLDL